MLYSLLFQTLVIWLNLPLAYFVPCTCTLDFTIILGIFYWLSSLVQTQVQTFYHHCVAVHSAASHEFRFSYVGIHIYSRVHRQICKPKCMSTIHVNQRCMYVLCVNHDARSKLASLLHLSCFSCYRSFMHT